MRYLEVYRLKCISTFLAYPRLSPRPRKLGTVYPAYVFMINTKRQDENTQLRQPWLTFIIVLGALGSTRRSPTRPPAVGATIAASVVTGSSPFFAATPGVAANCSWPSCICTWDDTSLWAVLAAASTAAFSTILLTASSSLVSYTMHG